MIFRTLIVAIIFLFFTRLEGQQNTYCNPMNLDYGYCPIPAFYKDGKHRATADPVIVNYKNTYYLFSTNQWGYWWSENLLEWNFISKKFLRPWNKSYDELCAPAVGIIGDTMLVFGSTYTKNFTLWMSTNPKENIWKPLVDSFEIGGWDPAFFTDDDGKFYMYNGSSNRFPLYGVEIDRKSFKPKGTRKELYFLESWRYGWQRFGENQDNTFLDPFIEGAWVTKNNGKYYLQYGAPGTEFSGYADGVAISNSPISEFQNQSDPLSIKAGGFARGAGHGSTFKDKFGQYWHVSTTAISTKNNFERRLSFWPAGFDEDDIMYCNTSFGDYPHYVSNDKQKKFTNWFLLNYKKPVQVSTTLGNLSANNAVDENIETYWSAKTGNSGEWIQSDLGEISEVNGIQINFADQDVEFIGKSEGVSHKYLVKSSLDGKNWNTIIDKSRNNKDVPHDYIQLNSSVKAKFIRLENITMPTGKFAISGLRIFGKGNSSLPDSISNFVVLRTEKDKRSAWLKWNKIKNAYAYNIHYGISPNKLYNCMMVHDDNELWLKTLDSQKTYYFTIEAINESGITKYDKILKSE
jgi:xylan 1,4-beta-xylosidase